MTLPFTKCIMQINIIAACALNRIIGRHGRLPWSVLTDWTYFLTHTQGDVCIMGRKSFEEFPSSHERRAIVISRTLYDAKIALPHAKVAKSYENALEIANDEQLKKVWICGGEKVYNTALPTANKLFLTRMHMYVDGDTYFPSWHSQFTSLQFCRLIQDKQLRLDLYLLLPIAGDCIHMS